MPRLIQPSFLLCLLVLAAAEIFLHCTLSPLAVAAFQYGHHPDSGFQETADGMVHLAPGPMRDFFEQTFSRERRPGVFRVFTLGNSVEYWDAVGSHILSNTYPARVAEELNRRGIRAESINLGVTGYGTVRNEILLRKALGYAPNLIIFKLDVTNEYLEKTTAERARAFKSLWPQDWLWKSYLIQTGFKLKETRLLEHTLFSVIRWTAPGYTTGKKEARPAVKLPFDETSRRALDECLQLAREHGVPVLLVTQAFNQRDITGHLQIIDYGLSEFAATRCGHGVAMLSLLQLLGTLPIEETFTDQVHLARPTHQIVARAIADAVERQMHPEAGK